MRLRWLTAALLLLPLTAPAQPRATPERPELAIPRILPPAARAPGEPAGWELASGRDGDAPSDASRPLVERIRPASSAEEAAPAGWLQVEYTIDRGLEQRVREVLERSGVRLGHVVLMDPATGDLLAYVSTDPVAFPGARTYPMASLAKLVTAAAALRRDPDATRRECRYVGSPWELRPDELVEPRDGGTVDPFWRTLAVSNNQCFARLAVHEVGADGIFGELEGLGLLDSPAPGHPPGRFDPVADALELGRLGSGLAGSFITPLAAARLAAVLARGELVSPRWLRRLEDSSGRALELPPADPPRRVWSAELADELRELLVHVTTDGTARRAFHDAEGRPLLGGVRVAGKTGTLRGSDPAGLYQWFIGVAPAEEPRIAIASVVVDGSAGHGAPRIAAEVLERILCDAGRCASELLEASLAASARRRAELLELASRAPADPPVETLPPLDSIPRPLGAPPLEFPRRLRERPASGRIVLLLDIGADGEVRDVAVEGSDLPDFDEFVVGAVRRWRFAPATRDGVPVEARARLPIPIRVK